MAIVEPLEPVDSSSARQGAGVDPPVSAKMAVQAVAASNVEGGFDLLAVLQTITLALSEAVTPAQVAAVIAEQSVTALGASSSLIFRADDDHATLRLIGQHGVAEQDLDDTRALDVGAPAPVCAALRSGQPEFLGSRVEYLARYPATVRPGAPPPRAQALAALPLTVEGRRIGAMLVCFREQRVFDDSTRAFAVTLARQCAQALDRARLYELERRSREQTALLVEAGVLLSTSLEPETTLRTLVRLAVPRLGDVCMVDAITEAGELVLTAVAHVDAAQEDGLRELRRQLPVRLHDRDPAAKAARTGKPQVRYEAEADIEAMTLDEEQLRMAAVIGARSAVFLPLLARGKVLGVLTLGQIEQRYAPGDVAFLQEFARRAALALDNARLYEAERRARAEAEAAQRRLAFLSEASPKLLDSALDHRAAAEAVVRILVPAIATSAILAQLDEEGTARRLAAAHSGDEPDHEGDVCPPGLEALLDDVLRSGRPRFLNDIPLRRDFGAVILIPLTARGQQLGVLCLTNVERGYDAADLAVAEELGYRSALALDNARLYGRLEEANRLKDEFLGVVSHELRTPLNAILGWARMLRTGKVQPGAGERALETIERNATLQAQLVEDLMDASRIITGKLRLELRPLDLTRVVEAAIDSVSPTATAKGVVLRASLDRNVGPLLGDAGRLQQVAWNLLSNAIKFSPRGAAIDVRLERVGAEVRLIVTDQGEGIAPAFLPHVFDRFRQGDGSTTRRHGGLGLGLSIVRHLVEAHGGSVRAESEGKGRGATFTVELPLTPVAGDRSSQSVITERAPELAGVRVLLVEDEPDGRELLRQALTSAGAVVEAARSVAEAMAALPRARPQVIVSDIGMPGEDGLSLIRRVRALPPDRGGALPAIAITAYATPDDRAQVLAAGFQVHVAKPIDFEQLAAAIVDLVRC